MLQDTISALKNQTYLLSKITVINNSSEDGTLEWLIDEDIDHINQPNVGSSGGQYRALYEAEKLNVDYVWIMDDDVVPKNDCLENLVHQAKEDHLLAPLRIAADGNIFENEPETFNLTNPFKSIWGRIIKKEELRNNSNLVYAEGLTFEGLFLPKEAITKIGYPEFDFFIHADDSDYLIRAKRKGYRPALVSNAIMQRQLPAPDLRDKFTWKHYYVIRNIIALDILHGSYLVKKLRPLFYRYSWLKRAQTSEEKETVRKAFRDGIQYETKPHNKVLKELGIK
ncbi:MAG: glycosyltransferase family 2 protein [Candidatus Kapaibacteriales bacterium]